MTWVLRTVAIQRESESIRRRKRTRVHSPHASVFAPFRPIFPIAHGIGNSLVAAAFLFLQGFNLNSAQLLQNGPHVLREPGMIESVCQRLTAPATAHVEAVDGEPGIQQTLSQGDHVAAGAGTFQAVMQ